MRRLTALIKKIAHFPAEKQTESFKIIKALDLLPGEWIPDDLPSGTSIFIEQGFLLLTRHRGNQWKCVNFFCEGTAAITDNKGAAEMQEGSFRILAIEPSRIYYLTPDDECRLKAIFPLYAIADSRMRRRSFVKDVQRALVLNYLLAKT